MGRRESSVSETTTLVEPGPRRKVPALLALVFSPRAALPSVDRLLRHDAATVLIAAFGRRAVTGAIRAELDEIRRRLMQLQIEQEALRKEKDPASRQQLAQRDFLPAEIRCQPHQPSAEPHDADHGHADADQGVASAVALDEGLRPFAGPGPDRAYDEPRICSVRIR